MFVFVHMVIKYSFINIAQKYACQETQLYVLIKFIEYHILFEKHKFFIE